MLERVTETVLHLIMFGPGQRVGVAVSGGADSVALLHILRELAPRWDLKLQVLHFNHHLRGAASDEDARFVESLAQTAALPFQLGEADVAGIARETGDNLEQAARHARYGFFRGFLEAGKLDRVALGHTRSDQAETVLYRLLRGSGTTGLAAIRPVTPEGFVRPLIDLGRTEVVEFLRARGIEWREDTSNSDLRFDRNRIRHELMPALARDWNPRLEEALARLASVALDEERYWDGEISRVVPDVLTLDGEAVLLRLDRLRGFPAAVVRRLIRHAVEKVKGNLRRLDFAHCESVLELVRSPRGDGRIDLPGLSVCRSFDWIRLAPPARGAPRDYRIPLAPPAEHPLPGAKSSIIFELQNAVVTDPDVEGGYNTGRGDALDWERVSGPLTLRNWRPGDRFRAQGREDGQKLKLLFQRHRVPSWQRPMWPIVTSADTIVWTRRFGVAEGYAAGANSRNVLRIRED